MLFHNYPSGFILIILPSSSSSKGLFCDWDMGFPGVTNEIRNTFSSSLYLPAYLFAYSNSLVK